MSRAEDCKASFADFDYENNTVYCPSFYDNFLCWAPTPAGQTVYQNCPAARLSDVTQKAYRVCGDLGLWRDRHSSGFSTSGWTNYTPCFPDEVRILFEKVSEDAEAQMKFDIARRTRLLEIIGFSISFLSLLSSLLIFIRFRSLHNHRTRIHKSLFTAMLVQVIIRLTVYFDQEYVRAYSSGSDIVHGIDNMPYVCETSYVLLEYGNTVMFLWMFLEGLYLNSLVSSKALKVSERSYFVYFLIGWGIPFVLTVTWAIVTAMHYQKDHVKKCWYGYNFEPIYWIVQGPRLAVVMINFVFLLNILRVLLVKMRETSDTEVQRVRYRLFWLREITIEPHQLRVMKALRAAFVLLPLLGLTNALDMTEAPLDGSAWQFAIWSYSTHFLRSFQGFFISLLYCFMNAEVRAVIRKQYQNYKAIRETRRRQRTIFRNNGLEAAGLPLEPLPPIIRPRLESDSSRYHGRQMSWARTRASFQSDYPEAHFSVQYPDEVSRDIRRASQTSDTDDRRAFLRRHSPVPTTSYTVVTIEHQRSAAMINQPLGLGHSEPKIPSPDKVEEPATHATLPRTKRVRWNI